jgi:hypothetical protein
MGIIGIGSETVASAQFGPRLWHDLHQTHGAFV